MNRNNSAPHWSQTYMPRVVELIGSIRDYTRASCYSELWTPQAYEVGGNGQSLLIAGRNFQRRRRLLIWADVDADVWIGAAPHNGPGDPGARDGYVFLQTAVNSPPLELFHCGDVWAWSTSQATVCVVAEFGRA